MSIAKRIWDEWARHECDGQLTTPYWSEDILSLRSGDRIQVKLRPDIEAEIRQLGNEDLAAKKLMDVYSIGKDVATILVREATSPLQDLYRLDTMSLKWPEAKATIKFYNLIRAEEPTEGPRLESGAFYSGGGP